MIKALRFNIRHLLLLMVAVAILLVGIKQIPNLMDRYRDYRTKKMMDAYFESRKPVENRVRSVRNSFTIQTEKENEIDESAK
jgi:hypothetical protein